MEYTYLGRTGLKVSRLCLGTMNFGPDTDEPQSHAIMDAAHDVGINFFDTADIYGWKLGEGVTEQIIGRWFAQGGNRREKTVLATKVFGDMGEWPNTKGLSALHIKQAVEASLRRLQTDHIDLYQMHHIDPKTPWDEIWQAMEQLVREGKVLYVGSSNFAGWQIAQANGVARSRNFLGLVSEQCHYNLIARQVESELLPACEAFGVGVIPWGPLGGGALGGVLKKPADTKRRSSAWTQREIATNRETISAFESFCADIGEPPARIALAWILHNPVVTAPIIGPRTCEQLEKTLAALTFKFSKDELEELDRICPGPGGAPGNYAR